ncbi:TPA: amidohydrolase [Klebsiella pneumoniae]|nr:amidohydrolase [Klebsiella pneumoniae subsp. pneumoniae]HDU5445131.1 amidohydrolase [Klebsiella pneumoniae]HDU5995408.1 amidohydrolase [Klebsiella pneumoniae subsp. pneumoniae]HDU6095887.1 amidohydrolase [Klebsiella pneumoniae]
MSQTATLILTHGQIHTLDRANPLAEAVAIADGKIVATGSHDRIMSFAAEGTQIVDLKGHTVIPGLNDSHLHLIRGGLNYNLELRWEDVPSLADALRMLKDQADRTPSPQWVRVVGGWSEFQFAERRMPTLEELNEAAPDTPVFVLHLYDRALLNRAALKAVGYSKETPDPAGGEIVRDSHGNPTGMLIAKPNAMILYATLAKGPKLPLDLQVNSTRQFMRELNRLGLTSAIDAGEMLVFSAADFEDFLQPRPDLPQGMEDELERVVRHLVEHRWPFRLHATYDESISRMLDVFEKVNRDIPFNGLHWFFDHAETITERNIERVKALGGGIAVQHRMAFQGEYFVDRYGKEAVKHTPPVAKMLALDVPVGLGTDATRVASYNPWTALYWLVSGRTVGGMAMYDDANRLPRDVALELWTAGSAWFSSEQGKKGRLAAGQLADLVVLSKDYFSVAEEEIKGIESVLTVVDGKVVYAAGHFSPLAPPPIPVLPEWSPVVKVPGHYRSAPPATAKIGAMVQMHQCCGSCGVHGHQHDIARKSSIPVSDEQAFWGVLGCSCFAF